MNLKPEVGVAHIDHIPVFELLLLAPHATPPPHLSEGPVATADSIVTVAYHP